MDASALIAAIAGPAGMALVAWYLLTKFIPGIQKDSTDARKAFMEELKSERKSRENLQENSNKTQIQQVEALTKLTGAVRENTNIIRSSTKVRTKAVTLTDGGIVRERAQT